jgi:predicted nucleic acid-binding Zn finger protein
MNNQIISYSDGKWQARDRNGRILRSFSPGPDGRLAALKKAAGWRNPLILAAAEAMIRKHSRPEVTSRAWRAVETVASGGVFIPADWQGDATLCRVWSSGKETSYVVSSQGKNLHCTCHDYHHNAPRLGNGRYCKHIMAVLFALIAGIQPEQPDICQGQPSVLDRWQTLAAATSKAAGVVAGEPAPAKAGETEQERETAGRVIPYVQSTAKRMTRNAAFRELDRKAEARRAVAQGNAALFGE